MGLFDAFKKKTDSVNEGKTKIPFGEKALNLSKEDSMQFLDLRKDVLKETFSRINFTTTKARVILVMDISGSMRPLFKDGTVQYICDRVLPVAIELDDNGELDVYMFSASFKELPAMTINNYYGYIEREVMKKSDPKYWSTTKYAPVMNEIFNKYTQVEPSGNPTYVLFITDGANDDKTETTKIITELSKHNIFWQFVGIGKTSFPYLEKLDDLKGRYMDNADFMAINDLNKISDQELYKRIFNEYPSWEKEAKKKGLIK